VTDLVLGPKLSSTAVHQEEIRPSRALLRASRGRQRRLERRRLHPGERIKEEGRCVRR
jgi:hypothetical protein